MSTPRPRTALLDLGLLLARVAVGVTFVMHGWQKFDQGGIGGTTQMLTQSGAPYPQVAAYLLLLLEVGGGILLILGVLVRPIGLLFALDMAGAIALIHYSKGFFVADGGYELAGLLGVLGLMFALSGGGRFGVDGIFAKNRRTRAEEKRLATEPEPTETTRVDQFGRV